MKHLDAITKQSPVAATTSLNIKLTGVMSIIDRLLLAQRQSAWKVPFPTGNEPDTSTDTTDTTV
ncbi:MAG: hypothetical protein GWP08_20370 [Nitrospiraceae bacterium]|nr:hypothetical protein [Nitrospiraceae bacterium]